MIYFVISTYEILRARYYAIPTRNYVVLTKYYVQQVLRVLMSSPHLMRCYVVPTRYSVVPTTATSYEIDLEITLYCCIRHKHNCLVHVIVTTHICWIFRSLKVMHYNLNRQSKVPTHRGTENWLVWRTCHLSNLLYSRKYSSQNRHYISTKERT